MSGKRAKIKTIPMATGIPGRSQTTRRSNLRCMKKSAMSKAFANAVATRKATMAPCGHPANTTLTSSTVSPMSHP